MTSPLRRLAPALALTLLVVPAARAQYSIKEAQTAAPRELKPEIQKLLDDKSVQVLDGSGAVLCELWFRKEVPSKATAAQVKNGLTYQEFEETTLLGVLRVEKTMTDYRKQKIKEGVYTLRLAVQPQDGDHMGTAPHPEFCLLVPASQEKDAAPMEPKKLHELSMKASGTTHPGVFLLFPPKAKADAAAKLSKEEGNHWVLTRPVAVKAGDLKTTIGFSIAVVGTSSAA